MRSQFEILSKAAEKKCSLFICGSTLSIILGALSHPVADAAAVATRQLFFTVRHAQFRAARQSSNNIKLLLSGSRGITMRPNFVPFVAPA